MNIKFHSKYCCLLTFDKVPTTVLGELYKWSSSLPSAFLDKAERADLIYLNYSYISPLHKYWEKAKKDKLFKYYLAHTIFVNGDRFLKDCTVVPYCDKELYRLVTSTNFTEFAWDLYKICNDFIGEKYLRDKQYQIYHCLKPEGLLQFFYFIDKNKKLPELLEKLGENEIISKLYYPFYLEHKKAQNYEDM